MILFTGDTHGGIDMHKLSSKNLRKHNITLGENDHLIICGDFGLPFYPYDVIKHSPTNGEYRFRTRFLEKKKCRILFVDGNHDNHDFWREQPVSEWHGGKVHFHPHISNAIHLMRGEIYENVDGKNIFAFGGAASHDAGPVYIGSECVWKGRQEGISWWQSETASQSDIENAEKNLDRFRRRVDCIVTHTPPFSVVERFFPQKAVPGDSTAHYLDKLTADTDYDFWICGHIHSEYAVPELKLSGVYNEILSCEDISARIGNSQ